MWCGVEVLVSSIHAVVPSVHSVRGVFKGCEGSLVAMVMNRSSTTRTWCLNAVEIGEWWFSRTMSVDGMVVFLGVGLFKVWDNRGHKPNYLGNQPARIFR